MSGYTTNRRRVTGLGRYAESSGLGKPKYCQDIHLHDDHPCVPLPPTFPAFNASNELWSSYPRPIEQNDWVRRITGEQAPTRAGQSSSTSQEELTRLSSRPYSLRARDDNDFASVWESTVIPALTNLLQQYCDSDFAVDVHNFPELSTDAVPRVIYITLSDYVDPSFEETIRNELAVAVPSRFNPIYLKFRRGGPQRSGMWWGQSKEQTDYICEPRNITYRPNPIIGISIGPVQVSDAASLGGFVKIGSELYAMSAAHAFEEAVKDGHSRVKHPANPDFPLIRPSDPRAKQYFIGTVAMKTPSGTLRPSLTFQNTDFAPELTKVEMDWCLIGPVANGKNVISVPSFQMDQCVAVEQTAAVEGNTEVYAMARTSGYSLGFVSDVPGLQRIDKSLRREWTVRQYSPFKHPKDSRTSAPWQTVKQWVTSGIGVPGDSGAWLMRRKDNAVIGLIWGRNHDYGDPLERIRLTYFTPMVDILKDVSLPAYSARELARASEHQRNAVQLDASRDPWTLIASNAIQHHRHSQEDIIQTSFVDPNVPPSGAVFGHGQCTESILSSLASQSENVGHVDVSVLAVGRETTSPRSEGCCSTSTLHSQDRLLLGIGENVSVPGLSSSSSIHSSFGSMAEPFDAISAGNGVHIVEAESVDEDIIEVEEPVRSKACFPPARSSAFARSSFVPP
ncbi:hypothetical protein QBC40DRAFT_173528 [Triangularia verruculosa]|uniref:Uncharacterized protein n=1 Tax=Triangularia verruculosa TaxID=2587418 RepID=A0AAN6XHZ6_9PEZI|nr:hypothetical protein QBC40DRAFT_173528 [Triangularia verruculosa]